ncbi:MAG: peptidylprolyl isomerase [Oscillochloridaceae bacterium umkhey_bin13]
MHRAHLLLAGLIALLLALTGCQSTQNGQALFPASQGPVIMRFGSEQFTEADFARRLDRDIGDAILSLIAQGQTPDQIEQLAIDSDIRRQIFDQWVQDLLLGRYALQHGIGVDPARVDNEVLSGLAPIPGSPFLITTDQRVRSARNQQVFAVIARHTTAPMTNARTILVTDQAQADAIMADLAAGAAFASLASTRSLDPISGANGGDLGWLPPNSLAPELEQAIAEADLNSPFTLPLPQGVFVIEVLERDPNRSFASFDALAAHPDAQQFYEASFVPWFEGLRNEAQQSGELVIAPNFDPNSVPLPFP